MTNILCEGNSFEIPTENRRHADKSIDFSCISEFDYKQAALLNEFDMELYEYAIELHYGSLVVRSNAKYETVRMLRRGKNMLLFSLLSKVLSLTHPLARPAALPRERRETFLENRLASPRCASLGLPFSPRLHPVPTSSPLQALPPCTRRRSPPVGALYITFESTFRGYFKKSREKQQDLFDDSNKY